MITWNTVAHQLAIFEEEYADKLCSVTVQGYNAWQIVKPPLYFLIIKNTASPAALPQPVPATAITKTVNWIRLLASSAFGITGLWLKGLTGSRRDRVLFYTYSADKLAKDAQGQYFNFLVDGFVTRGIVKNYIYSELSQNGHFKTPSPVTPGFKLDRLNGFANYKTWRSRNSAAVQAATERLEGWLTDYFFKNGIDIRLPAGAIKSILLAFIGQYYADNILLKAARPSLIIASEVTGSGLIAAAIRANVPVIELQHGLMDQYHPQYTYSSKLAACKKNMALPTWIGVFGPLHKNILLAGKFWNDEEIVVLGNCRIEMNRERYGGNNVRSANTILFPTQWTSFEDTMQVLRDLLPGLPSGVRLVLKLHPLEREEYIAQYRELLKTYPNLVIEGKEKDIYPLIHASRLVIGFDSTVLLEAISMGVPSITITTPTLPDGIHSLFNSDELKDAIKVVGITEPAKLTDLVRRSFTEEAFYAGWSNKSKMQGDALYAGNYFENCKKFIHAVLN